MASRLETFNATAVVVFDDLYQSFPHGVSLYNFELVPRVREILGDDEVNKGDVAASVIWLAKNNYVTWERHALKDEGTGAHYSLSDKGLIALQRAPDALGPSLANRVKELATDGAQEAGKQAISNVIGEVIGSALKSMMG